MTNYGQSLKPARVPKSGESEGSGTALAYSALMIPVAPRRSWGWTRLAALARRWLDSLSCLPTNDNTQRSFSILSVILLSLWLSVLPVHAATFPAATANQTDVQNAIALASTGDTVTIPTGAASWSGFTLTKQINLIGAGTNNTQISCGGTALNLLPSADNPVRISGIWFIQTGTAQRSVTGAGKCQALRIDHCLFTGGNKRAIFLNGWIYGVIDHCRFISCDIAISPQDDEGSAAGNPGNSSNWAQLRPLQPGTTNLLYIEDNLFSLQSADNFNNLNEQIYHFDSSRTVIRFNTFDASAGNSGNMIDVHGNQSIWGGNNADTSNDRQNVGGEIYNNVFKNAVTSRAPYIRGGSWLIFSNRWDNGANIVLTEEEGWNTGFFNPSDTTWPAQEQITNTFIWNNTNSGGLVTSPNLAQGSDPIFIQNGRDYWTHPPQSGQKYYPYTPLVYPHPLVSGVSPGPSTNPVISITPSSGDYGAVAIGSTNDLTFTVQNVGGGTLAGSVSAVAPFSIVGSSIYSLASNATKIITIRYIPTQTGNDSQTVTFTGGGGASATVSGSAVAVLPGLSFDSTAGAITTPFVSNLDNTISQTVETLDPASGGRAVYLFNIANSGGYIMSANVNAPADAANSLFVNIDAEPTSPNMIWDIPVTTGFTNQTVTWRGTGGVTPQVWTLNAGTHQLIVRGREAGVELGRITVLPPLSPPTSFRILAAAP